MSGETTQFMLSCDKENHESLHLVSTPVTTPIAAGIRLRIDKVGLSANNKFYMAFGENPPFSFFQAYPVPDSVTVHQEFDKNSSSSKDDEAPSPNLVNMPAWGLATVVESTEPDIAVGTQYRGMLPLANFVHFDAVKPTKAGDGSFAVVRPKTHTAYNTFFPVNPTSVVAKSSDKDKSDIALVSFPGIVTGFGLYHTLKKQNFYCPNSNEPAHVVISSASSKVALAVAFYLKQDKDATTKVYGYTSDQNRAFCESTGLYNQILGYNDDLPKVDIPNYVYIDIAGRGDLYQRIQDKVVKALIVGNTHSIPDASSTFSQFGIAATVKMMSAFMGLGFLTSFLHPKLEVFLIMEIKNQLNKEWGKEVFEKRFERATQDFCETAIKWGIQSRRCETLDTIHDAYIGILQGTIKPSEAVVVNVTKAVANVNVSGEK